ncbi:MAG: fibronectin type III domain-containing protein, partial [Planctomycetes bacterium]|nr:fibronectin type III domain-containing protein [Planctomycetota bacterium]
MRHLGASCLAVALILTAWAAPASAQTVTRGPYLQQGTNSQIIVRWRTDVATNSRVRYGTTLVSPLPTITDNATSTTEHIVTITGLAANTKYFYSVGSTTATLSGPDANTFFLTSPTPGVAKNTRIWVLGDAGTNNSSQKAVRDAYYTYTGTTHTDLWLMLGDNAYTAGTDAEFQNAVFGATNAYPAMLRKSVVWPTLGNHDGGSANSLTQT